MPKWVSICALPPVRGLGFPLQAESGAWTRMLTRRQYSYASKAAMFAIAELYISSPTSLSPRAKAGIMSTQRIILGNGIRCVGRAVSRR